MKTIPVSLIVAGILTPILSLAEPPGKPEARFSTGNDGKRGGAGPFMEAWKAADQDRDGFLSEDEFGMMPRIQHLPEEKRGNLFKRLDKNHDGKIRRDELEWMGRPHEGQGTPPKQLWELDVDKSGGVSLEEFKTGQFFKKLTPEKQAMVFRRLDTNGDGIITPGDKPKPPHKREGGNQHLKRPEGGKPEDLRMAPRQIMRQLDKDGDKSLSFEEFRAGPAFRDLGEDEQEDRFEAMDRNGDLKLTADELKSPPPPAPRQSPAPGKEPNVPPEGPPSAADEMRI